MKGSVQALVAVLLLSNLILLGKLGIFDAQAQEAASASEACHTFQVRRSALERGADAHAEPGDAVALPAGWRGVGATASSSFCVVACKTLP